MGIALLGIYALPVTAAPRNADSRLATSATFVPGDFPPGFGATAASVPTNADNIRLAKGVAGCGPYITLEKSTSTLSQARSPRFGDGSRTVENEVDVFKTDRAARDALVLYAKPSVAGCLKKLYEKQIRANPALLGKVAAVAVTLARQDIAGLGDDRVVYEGTVVVTGTDGLMEQVAVGTAAVRVGRVVDAVSSSSTGADLTEILTPAIDASVARLRDAESVHPTT